MKTKKLLLSMLLCAAVAVMTACVDTAVGSYQSLMTESGTLLAAHTSRSLNYEGVLRNPVIIIHGIFGSRLQSSADEELWGTFSPKLPSQKIMRQLAFPMRSGVPLNQIKDGSNAFAMLDTFDVHVGNLQLSMDGYKPLIDLLQGAGYVLEGGEKNLAGKIPSLYVFYYDWRRSVADNAISLSKFIEEKNTDLKKQYEVHYGIKNYETHFDLVAHSMGGLISRYYLRYGALPLPAEGAPNPIITWAGAKRVDKLIQIGTPNAGYLDTLLELNEGLKLQAGAPVYPKALIGTFPSYYQMLPFPAFNSVSYAGSGEPVDLYDSNVWIKHKWGLANPDCDSDLEWLLPDAKNAQERRTIALDHLKKCLYSAKRLSSMLSTPDPKDSDVFQMIFVGDAVETASNAKVYQDGSLEVTRYDSGDGKVSAVSARSDLRDPDTKGAWSPFMDSPVNWSAVYHVSGAHMGITVAPEFIHNIRFYLIQFRTNAQRKRTMKD